MHSSIRSFSRTYPLVALIVVAVTAAACGGGDDPPSQAPPPALNVPFSQTDLRVGTGAEAVLGRNLTVNYTGWLYSTTAVDNKGEQFDSNAGRGPYPFTLGGNVIAGWNQGVVGMRVGGMRRLVIPPNLAYGSQGRAPIPPNATLIFDIELLTVQ